MKSKKIAIVQSSYVPWRGFFDLIGSVDEFILFDDMQYTKRDWRNRNKIKTSQGVVWLTVPVITKGAYLQKISEVIIADEGWRQKHLNSIKMNYRKSPHFEEIYEILNKVLLGSDWKYLYLLNRSLICEICNFLGIETKISWSWDYNGVGKKSERLASIAKDARGTHYVSGPSAKDYIDEQVFGEAGLQLEWFEYKDLVEYPQIGEPFLPNLSIIDLLMNTGKDARKFLPHANM